MRGTGFQPNPQLFEKNSPVRKRSADRERLLELIEHSIA